MVSTIATSSPNIDASSATREVICDQCDQEIAWGELLLLREAYRMPEAPEFHLHEDCATCYIEQHEGIWDKMLILPDKKGWMFY